MRRTFPVVLLVALAFGLGHVVSTRAEMARLASDVRSLESRLRTLESRVR